MRDKEFEKTKKRILQELDETPKFSKLRGLVSAFIVLSVGTAVVGQVAREFGK